MNRKRTSFFFLSALLLLSSCDSITNGRKEDNFRANQNLWQEKNIENYSFEFSKLCYCGGLFNPSIIVVKAGTIHAVLDSETGEPLRDPHTDEMVLLKYPESFLTIDELFKLIENARENADKLDVEYDRKLGYPTVVEIDYIKEAIDDEVTYRVHDFRIE